MNGVTINHSRGATVALGGRGPRGLRGLPGAGANVATTVLPYTETVSPDASAPESWVHVVGDLNVSGISAPAEPLDGLTFTLRLTNDGEHSLFWEPQTYRENAAFTLPRKTVPGEVLFVTFRLVRSLGWFYPIAVSRVRAAEPFYFLTDVQSGVLDLSRWQVSGPASFRLTTGTPHNVVAFGFPTGVDLLPDENGTQAYVSGRFQLAPFIEVNLRRLSFPNAAFQSADVGEALREVNESGVSDFYLDLSGGNSGGPLGPVAIAHRDEAVGRGCTIILNADRNTAAFVTECTTNFNQADWAAGEFVDLGGGVWEVVADVASVVTSTANGDGVIALQGREQLLEVTINNGNWRSFSADAGCIVLAEVTLANNPALTEINLPSNAVFHRLYANGCPALTTIAPPIGTTPADYVNIESSAATTATLDALLAWCVRGGVSNGYFYGMCQGTPSAQGLADRAILRSRGWAAYTQED